MVVYSVDILDEEGRRLYNNAFLKYNLPKMHCLKEEKKSVLYGSVYQFLY